MSMALWDTVGTEARGMAVSTAVPEPEEARSPMVPVRAPPPETVTLLAPSALWATVTVWVSTVTVDPAASVAPLVLWTVLPLTVRWKVDWSE